MIAAGSAAISKVTEDQEDQSIDKIRAAQSKACIAAALSIMTREVDGIVKPSKGPKCD